MPRLAKRDMIHGSRHEFRAFSNTPHVYLILRTDTEVLVINNNNERRT